MSLFGKLASLTTVVAATLFAKKVADKVKGNNPEGVSDSNNNGKIDIEDYASEIKKAASEVYHETSDAIKNKAPETFDKIKQAAGEVKSSITETYYDVKNSFSKPAEVIDIKPDSVSDADDLKEDEN